MCAEGAPAGGPTCSLRSSWRYVYDSEDNEDKAVQGQQQQQQQQQQWELADAVGKLQQKLMMWQ